MKLQLVYSSIYSTVAVEINRINIKFSKLFFIEFVNQCVSSTAGKINFLTANGMIFKHPLEHMGKKFSDLPLICIDSLKHMFSYPYKSKEDLVNLEKLHRYLQDFYSQRLHMKYHGLVSEVST